MTGVSGIEGALLGTAAGDVYGRAVEGAGRAEAAAAVFGGTLPRDGERYSDDTQQALVLAYHLLRHGGVAPDDLADDFAAHADVIRGIGPGFRDFVEAHRSGMKPAARPSAGNGAAMRSAPVAIWCHSRPETIIDSAISAAAVTHADPRGVAAGVALPAAVMCAAQGVEGPDLVWDAADHVTESEHRLFADEGMRFRGRDSWHTLSLALRAAAPLTGADPEYIADEVGRRAMTTSRSGSASGTHPYAPASVVTAITIAAGGGDDPAAVRAAVALGGDTDTVGAMVGAIIGARRGGAAWPWPVPNADLLLDVGHLLAERGSDRGLPDLGGAVAL